MTYGYGDKPEDIQRRIDGCLSTSDGRPVAVSINGGPLVFGLLCIEFEEGANFGFGLIASCKYSWSVQVEASPLGGLVELAMGQKVDDLRLSGRASGRSWRADVNERMWTIYQDMSELCGLAA